MLISAELPQSKFIVRSQQYQRSSPSIRKTNRQLSHCRYLGILRMSLSFLIFGLSSSMIEFKFPLHRYRSANEVGARKLSCASPSIANNPIGRNPQGPCPRKGPVYKYMRRRWVLVGFSLLRAPFGCHKLSITSRDFNSKLLETSHIGA